MDLEKALKKIKHATIAGLISGILTLIVTIIAIAANAQGQFAGFNDYFMIIDILLIFGLTFGIHKKNRTCAVLMFLYFLISKISMVPAMGARSLLQGIFFLYFFFEGIRGTFAYHKLTIQEAKEEFQPKKNKPFLKIFGIIALVIFLLFLSLGILSYTGVMLPANIIKGSEMHDRHVDQIRSLGFLDNNEPIRYFYSDALFSIEKDGNFYTNQKVLSYWEEDNEIYFMDAAFPEIVDISMESSETDETQSWIYITKSDSTQFYLIVPNTDDDNETFYNNLLEEWEAWR
ncbi:hypothetical protein ACFL4L_02530 [bacterium]